MSSTTSKGETIALFNSISKSQRDTELKDRIFRLEMDQNNLRSSFESARSSLESIRQNQLNIPTLIPSLVLQTVKDSVVMQDLMQRHGSSMESRLSELAEKTITRVAQEDTYHVMRDALLEQAANKMQAALADQQLAFDRLRREETQQFLQHLEAQSKKVDDALATVNKAIQKYDTVKQRLLVTQIGLGFAAVAVLGILFFK
jgi:hypothetical protein